MTWYDSPGIERTAEGSVQVLRLLGDWTRDLPLELKRRASLLLSEDIRGPLVLDLTDLKFLDSWGEESIADLLQRVSDTGDPLAWVCDKVRSASYEGVRQALVRRQLAVAEFPSRTEAVASLKGPA